MSHRDHEVTEPPEVAVRCGRYPETGVRIFAREFTGEYETVFSIDAHADGLSAHISGVVVSVWDREYLATFLGGLAADFRGWAGVRTWSVNDLTLRATFRSGGHVELTWTLQYWSSDQDSWEASVTTWVDGGEQMAALVADVRAFLQRRP